MAYKRNRSEFEQSPNHNTGSFVLYGSALPPLDASTRDDGSYVPVWKQEVLDERGRKRLHGAFRGGFSAGYFNTVGSKEGWTPATFKSSRASRAATGPARPEDFMDEEDLQDAEEARKIETNKNFSGIGGPEESPRSFMDLLVPAIQDTMGIKLLKKMGWKEGQGVGPRTMRKARDFDGDSGERSDKAFLFAPENSKLVLFKRKDNAQGLGYIRETSIVQKDDGHDETGFDSTSRLPSKFKKSAGTAFGVGILNDDGEDDEDPYEIRPKSSYNKVIGGEKLKKKTATSGRPLKGKHVFVPKKTTALKGYQTVRKCHDGRLPLPGFILSDAPVQLAGPLYPPPVVPDDWKGIQDETPISTVASDPDKAVAKLDPRARGDILGEMPLPGKSVFDFLTPDARNRIASMTGKAHLPPGLGEAPASNTRSSIADLVPQLDSNIAMSALKGGFMPYGDDPEKRARYRSFLEVKAELRDGLPDRKYGMNTQTWAKEMAEFVGAARIFKPLTGTMATRFTPSTSAASNFQGNTDKVLGANTEVLVHRPTTKEEDPAEAAAKIAMYGPLTRSVFDFVPCRLLCKRFNVQFMGASEQSKTTAMAGNSISISSSSSSSSSSKSAPASAPAPDIWKPEVAVQVQVDADKNEALEGEKAADEVFKNIFGDSDDDDDE